MNETKILNNIRVVYISRLITLKDASVFYEFYCIDQTSDPEQFEVPRDIGIIKITQLIEINWSRWNLGMRVAGNVKIRMIDIAI